MGMINSLLLADAGHLSDLHERGWTAVSLCEPVECMKMDPTGQASQSCLSLNGNTTAGSGSCFARNSCMHLTFTLHTLKDHLVHAAFPS